MKTLKPQQQSICFLAAQPYALLVGKLGGFKTEAEFYRYAADECGFEGVALHPGHFDVEKALESASYLDDMQARLRGFGLRNGAIRFEMHGTGQNIALNPFDKDKTGHMVDGKNYRKETHLQIEQKAARQLDRIIDASAKAGFEHIVGFPGGRGYGAAQAKWPAWPKHLVPWILALLVHKWQPRLEYAADRGQKLMFEIGHPMNDLLTGKFFKKFYRMLSKKARRALGVNADASHFTNVGTNPIPHFEAAEETGCDFVNHYKWGAVRDLFDGGASPYGGWQSWAKASTSFYTIGTVGPESLVRAYHAFNVRRHDLQKRRVDIVYEGECVAIPNPKQAMWVGAENCRALRDNKALIRLEGFLDHHQPISLEPFKVAKKPQLAVGVRTMKIAPWRGGPFDAFADSPLLAYELLSMNAAEIKACRKILEEAGYDKAASVGLN